MKTYRVQYAKEWRNARKEFGKKANKHWKASKELLLEKPYIDSWLVNGKLAIRPDFGALSCSQ